MPSKKDQRIREEQKEKTNHIAQLNRWLEKGGYDYKVINYSACNFKGSKKDNDRMVATVQFMADGLQKYVTKNL